MKKIFPYLLLFLFLYGYNKSFATATNPYDVTIVKSQKSVTTNYNSVATQKDHFVITISLPSGSTSNLSVDCNIKKPVASSTSGYLSVAKYLTGTISFLTAPISSSPAATATISTTTGDIEIRNALIGSSHSAVIECDVEYDCNFYTSGISLAATSGGVIVPLVAFIELEDKNINNANTGTLKTGTGWINPNPVPIGSPCTASTSCINYEISYPLFIESTTPTTGWKLDVHSGQTYYRRIIYKNQGNASFDGIIHFVDKLTNNSGDFKVNSLNAYVVNSPSTTELNNLTEDRLKSITNIMATAPAAIASPSTQCSITSPIAFTTPTTPPATAIPLGIFVDLSGSNASPSGFVVFEEEIEIISSTTPPSVNPLGNQQILSDFEFEFKGQFSPSGSAFTQSDFCTRPTSTLKSFAFDGLNGVNINKDEFEATISSARLLPENLSVNKDGYGTFWDNSCIYQSTTGNKTKWIYAFTNNSLLTAYNVHIKLTNPNLPFHIPTTSGVQERFSYTYIEEASVQVNGNVTQTFNSGASPKTIPPSLLTSCVSLNTAASSQTTLALTHFPVSQQPNFLISNSSTSYLKEQEFVIDEFKPNKLFLLEFETQRACPEADEFLFNQGVDFNDWQITTSYDKDGIGNHITQDRQWAGNTSGNYTTVSAPNGMVTGNVPNNPKLFTANDISTYSPDDPIGILAATTGGNMNVYGRFVDKNYTNDISIDGTGTDKNPNIKNAMDFIQTDFTLTPFDGWSYKSKSTNSWQNIGYLSKTIVDSKIDFYQWGGYDKESSSQMYKSYEFFCNNHALTTTAGITADDADNNSTSVTTITDYGKLYFEVETDEGLFLDNGGISTCPFSHSFDQEIPELIFIDANGNKLSLPASGTVINVQGGNSFPTNPTMIYNYSYPHSSNSPFTLTKNGSLASFEFTFSDILNFIKSNNLYSTGSLASINLIKGSQIKNFLEHVSLKYIVSATCPAVSNAKCRLRSYFQLGDIGGLSCSGTGCKIPLSELTYNIDVLCPGCKIPGINVNHISLNRDEDVVSNWGYKDDDNDGLAESSTLASVKSGTAYANGNVYHNRSLTGDVLNFNLIGTFWGGNPYILGGNGDCNYSNLESYYCNGLSTTPPYIGKYHFFNYLYLDLDIPFSGPDVMDLDIDNTVITGSLSRTKFPEFWVQMNEQVIDHNTSTTTTLSSFSSISNCIASSTPLNFLRIENATIHNTTLNKDTVTNYAVFRLDYVPFAAPLTPYPSPPTNQSSVSFSTSNDIVRDWHSEKFYFQFDVNNPKFQDPSAAYASYWYLEEGQKYVVNCNFKSKGNPVNVDIPPSKINGTLYLSTSAKPLALNPTPKLSYYSPDDILSRAPLMAMEDYGNTGSPTYAARNDLKYLNPNPNSDNPFSDQYVYYCQGNSKGHLFLPTKISFKPRWSRSCTNVVEWEIDESIGKNKNYFEYEYRPLTILPQYGYASTSSGYSLSTTISPYQYFSTGAHDFGSNGNSSLYQYQTTIPTANNSGSPNYGFLVNFINSPATPTTFPYGYVPLLAGTSTSINNNNNGYYDILVPNPTTGANPDRLPNNNIPASPSGVTGLIAGDENQHVSGAFYYSAGVGATGFTSGGEIGFTNTDYKSLDNSQIVFSTGTPPTYVVNAYHNYTNTAPFDILGNVCDVYFDVENLTTNATGYHQDVGNAYIYIENSSHLDIDYSSLFFEISEPRSPTRRLPIAAIQPFPASNPTGILCALDFPNTYTSPIIADPNMHAHLRFKLNSCPNQFADMNNPITHTFLYKIGLLGCAPFDFANATYLPPSVVTNSTATPANASNPNQNINFNFRAHGADLQTIIDNTLTSTDYGCGSPVIYACNTSVIHSSNSIFYAGNGKDIKVHFEIDNNMPSVVEFSTLTGTYSFPVPNSNQVGNVTITSTPATTNGYTWTSTTIYNYVLHNNTTEFDIYIPNDLFGADKEMSSNEPLSTKITGTPNCFYMGAPPTITVSGIMYCGSPFKNITPALFSPLPQKSPAPACTLDVHVSTSSTCAGTANGTMNITICGGVPPYTLTLFDPSNHQVTTNITTTATGFTISNLVAGSYSGTVSDYASSIHNSFTLTAPTVGTTPSIFCGGLCSGCQGTVLNPSSNQTIEKWVLCNNTWASGGNNNYDVTHFRALLASLTPGNPSPSTITSFDGVNPSATSNYIQLVINDKFTIDQDFTFKNCDYIEMGPNAAIIINPGVKFTIDHCNIYAGCNAFWSSIRTMGSTTNSNIVAQLTMKNSELRDSYDGIYTVTGGTFDIEDNKFINNRNGIHLIDAYNKNNINFTDIEGNEFAYDITNQQVVGNFYNNRYVNMLCGIVCRNVGNYNYSVGYEFNTIGNPNTNRQNYFHDLNIGILNWGSNLEIYNNKFDNITDNAGGILSAHSPGRAIWGWQYVYYPSGGSNHIGGRPITVAKADRTKQYGNTFLDCEAAIWMEDFMQNGTVRRNDICGNEFGNRYSIDNLTGNKYYPNKKKNNIYFNGFNDDNMYIVGNNIYGDEGIGIYNQRALSKTYTSTNSFCITMNNVYACDKPAISLGNLSDLWMSNITSDGSITAADNTGSYTSPYYQCEIVGKNGIDINSVSSASNAQTPLSIKDSRIMIYPKNIGLTEKRIGLSLKSSDYTNIAKSRVSSDYYDNTLTTPQSGTYADDGLKGFYVDGTPNFTISCNEAHRMGQGFNFTGTCDLNNMGFIGNQMDDNYSQFVADISGTISDQGGQAMPSNYGTYDWCNFNKWTNNNTHTISHDNTLMMNNSQGILNQFYTVTPFTAPYYSTYYEPAAHNNGANAMSPTPVDPSLNPSGLPTNSDQCPENVVHTLIRTPISHKNDLNHIDGSVISISFSQLDEAKWNAARQLYDYYYKILHSSEPNTTGMSDNERQNLLKHYQNELAYVNDAMQNSRIATWYNTATNNNIGKFHAVSLLINAGNFNAAKTANAAIQPNLLPETNQKNFNETYINHYLRMQSIPNH